MKRMLTVAVLAIAGVLAAGTNAEANRFRFGGGYGRGFNNYGYRPYYNYGYRPSYGYGYQPYYSNYGYNPYSYSYGTPYYGYGGGYGGGYSVYSPGFQVYFR